MVSKAILMTSVGRAALIEAADIKQEYDGWYGAIDAGWYGSSWAEDRPHD